MTPPLRPVRRRPVVGGPPRERGPEVIVIGIDPHKRTHSAAAVDKQTGELRRERTVRAGEQGHEQLLAWARMLDRERLWALEDCRHVSSAFERFLLGHGERVVRVPPRLMGEARKGGRSYGKSDAIDALAVARAALREPELPVARLDGPSRELRLLVDHREDLVRERTGHINRLRWHLHELDPSWDPTPRSLVRYKQLDVLRARLEALEGMVAHIARDLVGRIRDLTVQANALELEIVQRARSLTPSLLELAGVGGLTAAKLVAEVADVRRFRSKDAFARHNGTAPLPVWSANRVRHRLS